MIARDLLDTAGTALAGPKLQFLQPPMRPAADAPLIVCTGATGYVGSALVVRLAEAGRRVRTFDSQVFGNSLADLPGVEHVKGDVRDSEAVRSAIAGADAVAHLAGIVVDELVDLNPSRAAEVNLLGTYNVARACREAGVRRLVYASSSSVYGHAAAGRSPVTEDVAPLPMTAYAWQKLAGEAIVNSFGGGPLSTVSVRSATAMGPAPRCRLDVVVNAFAKQAWFDGIITVHGGEQYRSNIHVDDVCALYERLIDADPKTVDQCAFNATAGNAKVIKIAELVRDAFKIHTAREVAIRVEPITDLRSYRLDASLARNILGWVPTKGVADAAHDNFDFFESGAITNPNDDIYFNVRRMKPFMEAKT